MTKQEFDKVFSLNISNKTESEDPELLEIYGYILEYENFDSDWWNEDHGTNDLMYIIKNCSANIFEKIKTDISNWTAHQIELFTQTLNSNDLKDFKVNERIELYLHLFEIQRTDVDLYGAFYYGRNINLSLGNNDLLIRLANRLHYESVECLLNSK
ncbi:hypothetical protein [Chryseobacterium hagamense]|uniref:Uncharacterized protein n=1 Tax=Chryseobacterium hagamense TaxID=395935 RepID=A0A511YRB2_9FLAO|nr:hypothetical protein [Chryseobacterium hagamense]GEN77730.1 hypothetical protein CHA01nite_34700 [Chryseobacterium hagamense]